MGEGETSLPLDAAKLIEVRNFDAEYMRKLIEESDGPLFAQMMVKSMEAETDSTGLRRHSGGLNSADVANVISMYGTLNGIMEALKCCDINSIGVCRPPSMKNDDLLEKVSRRAKRDNLFDVVVTANVSHMVNIGTIQAEIAEALDLKFDDDEKKDVGKRSVWLLIAEAFCLKFDIEKDDVAERAKRLRDRILEEEKILVILCDLHKGLDLDKVGIPLGADHTGCKLLLTSASEEVLSNQMLAQKVFEVPSYQFL